MSVLVVGMSHRSAPVSLLERLSMDDTVRHETATRLIDQPALSEAMIISTCNRLEVYSSTDSFHAGVSDVLDVLQEISGVDVETLRGYLYVRYADAAAEHMMVVTSGLDSMVVGEQQIIGQVRTAYQEAHDKGTVGPRLHSLAQSALHVGKRVHTETEIDEAGASMVTFALDKAREEHGREDFRGRTALVLGAGAMASLAATHLGKLGVEKLIIANRTRERAERLAGHAQEAGVAAQVIDYEDRAEVLADVDVAVSATGADGFTIEAGDVPAGRTAPLTLIDLSLPRDIDDAAGQLDGVTLVNIESLHKSITSRDSTSPSHRQAQEIIAQELAEFQSQQRVRDVVPALTAIRKSANEVVERELDRLRGRLPEADDKEFNEVTKALRRVVNELLHTPTVRAKELASHSQRVTYDIALEQLFGLRLDAPEDAPSVAVEATALPSVGRDSTGTIFTIGKDSN